MGYYENGNNTRRVILDACKRLFYEKGYHETSSLDIARESHTNRNAIYYHFKDKETIRYEVLWEFMTQDYDFVKQYCDKPEYQFSLAMYLIYYRILQDAKLRKLFLDAMKDYPVYDPSKPISTIYQTAYDRMYGHFWDKQNINPLAFASVYGHLVCIFLMCDQHPEHYTALELFKHCMESGVIVWKIPIEEKAQIWDTLVSYIERIPLDEVKPMYQDD